MSAPLFSPFECLVVPIKQPIPRYIRLYHPTYSPHFPASHLLSLLPLSTKLSLRLVTLTTKAWVDSTDPAVFSNLNVLFPLNIVPKEDLSVLHKISPLCEHLTVTVSEDVAIPRPSDVTPLPPLPRLKHLHLTAPDHDPFQRLLSFRLALQRANIPLLTHLTIHNLSLPGILALRWGSFTSFGDPGWTGGTVWQGLKDLDVHVQTWWKDNPHGESGRYDHEAEERETQEWRTYTRVLHDWLHSFAANGQLRTIGFEWADGEGPNPFLLDEIVARDRRREWFSAPGIRWTGLTELWLGNVVVSMTDVRRMKDRMAGLEELVVMPGFLDSGLGGRKIVDGDGGMWVGLRVEGNRVGHWAEVRSCRSSAAATTRGSWVATAAAAAGGAGYGGSRAAEDRASMMLPFMLDLSPEDGPCL